MAGYGRIVESVHAAILQHHRQAGVAAVAEPDAGRREAAKASFGDVRTTADYQELFAAPDLDAIVLCLPTGLHAEAGRMALASELSVYLEKPLATSLDQAEPLRPAQQPLGFPRMIGFNFRFHPLYLELKERLASGSLGRALGARTIFSSRGRPPAWKQRRDTGGGALLDLGSHHFDLVRFLFDDEIAAVSANVSSRESEDDTAWVTLETKRGARVQSLFALNAVEEDRFAVLSEAGTLSVDRMGGLGLEYCPGEREWSRLAGPRRFLDRIREAAASPILWSKLATPWREPSYKAALDHFIHCCLNGLDAVPDFEDGYRSLAVVDAAERSSRTGQLVTLPSSGQ